MGDNPSFTDFGYINSNDYVMPNNRQDAINTIIERQIKPLEKIITKNTLTHDEIDSNYTNISQNIVEYNKLLAALNEQAEQTDVTLEIGSQTGTEIKTYTSDVDTSYQELEIPPIVDDTNNPTSDAPADDKFKVSVVGKIVTVERVAGNSLGSGWSYNLKINGKIKSFKEKRYFHNKDDFEYDDKRKTHREKLIEDTKTVLLYNNQMYIAGTITTALAFIMIYKLGI
jgi:hypothetical protein